MRIHYSVSSPGEKGWIDILVMRLAVSLFTLGTFL